MPKVSSRVASFSIVLVVIIIIVSEKIQVPVYALIVLAHAGVGRFVHFV